MYNKLQRQVSNSFKINREYKIEKIISSMQNPIIDKEKSFKKRISALFVKEKSVENNL